MLRVNLARSELGFERFFTVTMGRESAVRGACREGIVVKSTEGELTVQMHREEACGSCASRKLCGAISTGSRQASLVHVRLPKREAVRYAVGDRVVVHLEPGAEFRAIALAYVLPVVVMLVGMFIFAAKGYREGIVALVGVGFIALYFGLLYGLRDRIRGLVALRVEPSRGREDDTERALAENCSAAGCSREEIP